MSDSTSVYLEDRYQTPVDCSGLTRADGPQPDAERALDARRERRLRHADRLARPMPRPSATRAACASGYGFDELQLSSAVEYRFDEPSSSTRTHDRAHDLAVPQHPQVPGHAGLAHHRQVQPLDQRQLARATSTTAVTREAVLGYAYRPVRNDRLNTLAKYTYFYNVPTTDQVDAAGRRRRSSSRRATSLRST